MFKVAEDQQFRQLELDKFAELVDVRLGGGSLSSTVFPDYTNSDYLGIC